MVPEVFKKFKVVAEATVANRFTPVAFVKLKFWVLRFVDDAVVAKEFTEVTLVNDALLPFTVVPDTVVAKSEVPVAFVNEKEAIVPDGVRSSVVDAIPPESTENNVRDDTSKFRKSPL